jgi:hypothetical protein
MVPRVASIPFGEATLVTSSCILSSHLHQQPHNSFFVRCTHFQITKEKHKRRLENGRQRITRSVAAATNSRSASKDVLHPQLHHGRRGATHSRQGEIHGRKTKHRHLFDLSNLYHRFLPTAGFPSHTAACNQSRLNSQQTTLLSPRQKCHLG